MLNLMIIHLVGLLSPGPDFFYVSRVSAMSSRREAIGGVIGITIGVLIWATAAVLGLAIIFATMPIIQGIVKQWNWGDTHDAPAPLALIVHFVMS